MSSMKMYKIFIIFSEEVNACWMVTAIRYNFGLMWMSIRNLVDNIAFPNRSGPDYGRSLRGCSEKNCKIFFEIY